MILIILRCRKIGFMQLRECTVPQRHLTFKQDYTWQLVKWLCWWGSTHWSCLTGPLPWQGSHLIMILLEEVELLLQAVQVSSQSGDDLVVVRLCPSQSLTVPLNWLAQGGLRLPPADATQWRIEIRGKKVISRHVQHQSQFVPLKYYQYIAVGVKHLFYWKMN